MLPYDAKKRTDSMYSDDTSVVLQSRVSMNPSRRASRALSISRLSKIMFRDSLSPAPTKEDFALDAEVALYKENEFTRFSELMHTMDKWLTKRKRIIRIALGVVYKTRYWSASYYKIKNVLRNFNAPCNEFEMHVVCRVLDTLEIRRVSYKVFSKSSSHVLLTNGLGMQKLNAVTQHSVPNLNVTPIEIRLFEEEKKFANILFIYAPFYDFLKHPGHFTEVVCLSLYVYSLKKIIEKRVELTSEVRVIYGMRFMENVSSLPWEYTLLEMGFTGGCEKFPTTLTLYYDIDTENRIFDCPLFLNSYYYLKDPKEKKKRSMSNTLTESLGTDVLSKSLSRTAATAYRHQSTYQRV